MNTAYPTLLATHSLFRWLVLVALLMALGSAYSGWASKRKFSRLDNALRHWSATVAHIQLLLGLWLYTISPFANHFLQHFSDAVHQRDFRFFGMEHSLMMVIAVVLVTIGSAKAKRKTIDRDKFKTMAIWYTIGLLIILASIPWAFSPFTSRPNFRPLF